MTPLRWTTLVLCAGALMVLWPLWPSLVLAVWTAALTRPVLVRFETVFRGRSHAAAWLSLLLFVMLAAPLVLITIGVLTGAEDLVALVERSPTATSALRTLISAPEADGMPTSLAELFTILQRSGTRGLGLLTNVAGAAVKGFIGLFIYFAGAYTFLLESGAIWSWILRHAPLEQRHLQRLGQAFHETGRGLLVGVGVTAAVQGLAATIIYLGLGVPRAWVLGPLTGMASIIPAVGTSLIWAPIAAGFFISGEKARALVLIILGLLVIGMLDNFLRPIFARRASLRMPLYLLFLSVFGGLAAFGVTGAMLGPLIVRLAIEVLALSKEEELSPSPSGPSGRGSG